MNDELDDIPEGFEAVDVEASVKNDSKQVDEIPDDFEIVEQPENEEGLIPRWVVEGAAAMNRPVVEFLDFLGPKTANSILSLSGSETRVPELMDNIPGIQGNFMDDGLAKDVVRAAGEAATIAGTGGAGLTKYASTLPQQGANLAQNVIKSVASTAPTTEAALGAASGAGGQVGKDAGGDIGELVGQIISPMAASGGYSALRGILSRGANGINELMKPLAELSEDAASKILAERMVRENLTPDEVLARLKELGPEAMPADLGNNFARLLRSASNEIPRVEALSKSALDERSAGQSARITESMEGSTGTIGLSVDDELKRIDMTLKPQIDEAYKLAKEKGEQVIFPEKPKLPSGVRMTDATSGKAKVVVKPKQTRLQSLLDGANVSGQAKKAADAEISAKRLSGEQVTKLDIIDAHKRALDDIIGAAIRSGEQNKARNFIKIKNMIVDEVDSLLPEYKAARDLFAGKAELENSAEIGKEFMKPSFKSKDVEDLVKGMSDSEKKFFKLGAKEAILNKMDDSNIGADLVKRLFNKNGSMRKLRPLFDSEESYNQFSGALEKESLFNLTRRAAQANSTTAKQQMDAKTVQDDINEIAAYSGEPVSILNRLSKTLLNIDKDKESKAYRDALESAGELLISKGVDAEKIIPLLEKGRSQQIRKLLKDAYAVRPEAKNARDKASNIAEDSAIRLGKSPIYSGINQITKENNQ